MMKRLQRLLATAAVPLVMFAQAAQAEVQCGGSDMLADYARTNPSSYEAVREQAKAQENTQALYWRVEKKGVSPSYLYGTMHLTDSRVTTLSPAASQSLQGAKSVVLEVADLSPAKLAAAMMGPAQSFLIYTDGRTLSAQLAPEEFDKVKAVVTSSGLPGEVAPMLRPWLISTLLSVSDCERQKAAGGAKVLDMQIADRAAAAGIPVNGLETIEEQLAALAGVPDDQQLQMLRVSLKYYERTNDMLETMLQLYLKRDMGVAMPFQRALAQDMNIPPSAFDGFEKALLVDRNARMAKAAVPYLDNGGAFIAIGALHLPGKTGVVALLRAAGYDVVPLE